MIEVDGLVRRSGKTTVIDGVSFVARTGEITAFLGPNGAGKTTTIRVLSTLVFVPLFALGFESERAVLRPS